MYINVNIGDLYWPGKQQTALHKLPSGSITEIAHNCCAPPITTQRQRRGRYRSSAKICLIKLFLLIFCPRPCAATSSCLLFFPHPMRCYIGSRVVSAVSTESSCNISLSNDAFSFFFIFLRHIFLLNENENEITCLIFC